MTVSAERIVLRWAKDFPTEDALRKYLKEHPDADKAKHHVDKSQKQGPKPEEKAKPRQPGLPKAPPPAGAKSQPPEVPKAKAKPPPIPEAAKRKQAPKPESKGQAPPAKAQQPQAPVAPPTPKVAPKPGRLDVWKSRFKGLSESASNFVEKSPKAIKHFFGDDEFRKRALTEAKDAITKAPKRIGHSLVEAAKDEVHEFKTASAGVKQVMTGKNMTKKQKHAFRAVATHMAIGATAAAFAASGPLAAAGLFAKSLAVHVAAKSVKKSLGHVHLLQEMGHIGHGVIHLIEHIASEDPDSKKLPSPDDAMAELVMACVAKEIDALTDEDLQEVLNSMPEGANPMPEDEKDEPEDEDAEDPEGGVSLKITNENEDWLTTKRRSKEASERILRRFLGKEFPTEDALKDYLQQHPKADKTKHTVQQKDTAKAPSESASDGGKPRSEKTDLQGAFKAEPAALDETISQNREAFDKATKEAEAAIKTFKPKVEVDSNRYGENEDLAEKCFDKFSDGEKIVYVGGHKVGEHFQQKVLDKAEKKLHERFFRMWTTSAGSYERSSYGADWHHESQEMQGLVGSLGVRGYSAPDDEEADKQSKGGVAKARKKGAKDEKLKAYVKKMYDYQQAYFKDLGLKEVTLYRGFQGQGIGEQPPPVGSEVNVQTRELSSYTANADIAKRFGRVVEYKVPVELIFASSVVRPEIGSETSEHSFSEAEFIVMGGSDLEGTIISKGGKDNVEDEPTAKTAAKRVVERYLAA